MVCLLDGLAGMARLAHVTLTLTLAAASSDMTQTNPGLAPPAWYGIRSMSTVPATAPCVGAVPSLNPADSPYSMFCL